MEGTLIEKLWSRISSFGLIRDGELEFGNCKRADGPSEVSLKVEPCDDLVNVRNLS